MLQLTVHGRIGVIMGIVWLPVEKVTKQGVENVIRRFPLMEA